MALSDAVSSAVAHWNLDESSGNRADSVGSNTLTDNNTVGSATGKFSNAADFESANSEFLQISDNADLSFGDEDFMLRAWVQLESKSALRPIIGKWNAGATKEYVLLYNPSGDRFQFFVSNDGSASASVTANNFGSPSTATWYLIHAWHDSVNNEIGIAVNAGTADTTAHTTGVHDGATNFNLGAYTSGVGVEYHDGLIDDVVILDGYILDATERSEDYNSGTGVAFADWNSPVSPSRLTLMGVS